MTLTFSSSGSLYNYGVLKRTVRVLGGKEAFPLKFDGWTAGREGQRVVEIFAFCKLLRVFRGKTIFANVQFFIKKHKRFCIY